MKVNVKDGIEPSATTSLPDWNEKYGGLVRPDKATIADIFEGSGVISGRQVPMSPVAQAWSGGTIMAVSAGEVSLNATPPPTGAPAVLTNTANGQCGVLVKYDATDNGYAGVVARWTNSSTERVVAIVGEGNLYLQEKSAAGATTRAASAPLDIANGDTVAIRLVAEGGTLTAYAGDVSVSLTGSIVNLGGDQCGMYFQARSTDAVAPLHKIIQFVAGTV